VIAEASTAKQAVHLAIGSGPDLCLLDVHMPGGGIAAAAEIRKTVPDCAVVMLTDSRGDDHELFDAVRAGARGYMRKAMDPGRVGPALLGVLAGEAAFPRSLVARMLEEFSGRSGRKIFSAGQRPTQLTAREWEIMQLLQAGASTAEVARQLFLAPGTIRVHISTVFKKLQVIDRASALQALEGMQTAS
jgi:DNA-binding NarL/FixJ family response regulator